MRIIACLFMALTVISCRDGESPSSSDALLTLRSDDVEKARLSVLTIAERRGQILESKLETGLETKFIARLQIPASAYYTTIKELSATGRLLSESSRVNLPAPEKQSSPEPAAVLSPGPQNPSTASVQTPAQTNVSVSKDKINIEVRISGPGSQDGLKIPAFREAIIGVINAILGLLYVFIWISPLALLYGVYRLTRKKKKAPESASLTTANQHGNPPSTPA